MGLLWTLSSRSSTAGKVAPEQIRGRVLKHTDFLDLFGREKQPFHRKNTDILVFKYTMVSTSWSSLVVTEVTANFPKLVKHGLGWVDESGPWLFLPGQGWWGIQERAPGTLHSRLLVSLASSWQHGVFDLKFTLWQKCLLFPKIYKEIRHRTVTKPITCTPKRREQWSKKL